MGQKCYCYQVDLTELKLKWSIENLKTHKKEDMKKFSSAWIFKQKMEILHMKSWMQRLMLNKLSNIGALTSQLLLVWLEGLLESQHKVGLLSLLKYSLPSVWTSNHSILSAIPEPTKPFFLQRFHIYLHKIKLKYVKMNLNYPKWRL